MAFEVSNEGDSPNRVIVGHWTDHEARTGCTVILFDRPAPALADVCGGAPGTRETDLLGDGTLVQSVDAILLTGGSAFGLAAADGVMGFLRERGRGVRTSAGPVPIVPAAALFDLSVGNSKWPDAAAGHAACAAATPISMIERGQVGAGCGATTRKLVPGSPVERGGIGWGSIEVTDGVVHAIVAVNAAGAVMTGAEQPDIRSELLEAVASQEERSSTTLAVVVIDAPTDRRTLARAAIAAHDAFARTIVPCHTIYDGDVVFATALRSGDVAPKRILTYSVAVEIAVERAIIDAVTA